MAKPRSLRRLVPDKALLERRAAGESLRQLAADYGIAHTTLLHYFRRPDVVLELREARRRLPARRKAARAQQALERRLEREVYKRAREDAERDRELGAWKPPERAYRTPEIDWRDLRDAPRGYASWETYSGHDRKAAEVVASGGGVEQVFEATGLRSREDVYRLDAQIISRALENDGGRPRSAKPDSSRLRRLMPDAKLLSRRAAGEPLRRLASDYGVSHTTLSRYFRRPGVAKVLRSKERARRGRRPVVTSPSGPSEQTILSEGTAEIRAEIRQIVCPIHRRRPTIRSEPVPNRQARLAVKFCCEDAQKIFVRRLSELDGYLIEMIEPTRG